MWIIISVLSLLFSITLGQMLRELREAIKLERMLKKLRTERFQLVSVGRNPNRTETLMQSLKTQTQLLNRILDEGSVQ